MKIAVFVNESMETSSINEASHVCVYQKDTSHFIEAQKIPVLLGISPTLSHIRYCLDQLVIQLGDCRIIVATKMNGLAYTVFERAGYNIWEYEGSPSNYLNDIELVELADRYELKDQSDPFEHFEDCGNGVFKINIKKLLYENHELTSKKLLLPFLDHMPFTKLHVTFSHLPPWLEPGLKKRGLTKELIVHEIDEHQIIIKKESDAIFSES